MLSVLAAFCCLQQSSNIDELRLDPAYLQAEMLRCSLSVAYNLNALNLEPFRIKKEKIRQDKEKKKKKKTTTALCSKLKHLQVYSEEIILPGDKLLAPRLFKKPSINSSLSDNGRQASSKDQIKYVVFPPKPILLSGLKVKSGLKTTRSGSQKKL